VVQNAPACSYLDLQSRGLTYSLSCPRRRHLKIRKNVALLLPEIMALVVAAAAVVVAEAAV